MGVVSKVINKVADSALSIFQSNPNKMSAASDPAKEHQLILRVPSVSKFLIGLLHVHD